jgi:hypothetical protein
MRVIDGRWEAAGHRAWGAWPARSGTGADPGENLARRRTLRGVLGQTFGDEGAQGRIGQAIGAGLSVYNTVEQRGGGPGTERVGSGGRVRQDRAKGEHIAGRGDFAGADLLR